MKVNIKKFHPDSKIPQYSKPGDAGLDLTCVSVFKGHDYVIYDTGLGFEIPDGYVGLLFPRSSNCKKDLLLSNSVGVLDSGFRGSVTFNYRRTSDMETLMMDAERLYEVGDRIGQLIIMPYPQIEFEEVEELSETERGTGGYGSTGN